MKPMTVISNAAYAAEIIERSVCGATGVIIIKSRRRNETFTDRL